ncbi:MAG: hypothetical protein KIS88_08925 [Anaerolineales bacterium]|nr:hypothetical protein [Anaerolineales bacterium]
MLKFSLLENALDSLRLGLEFVLELQKDKSKLKLSILLVAQAVELTLKERLHREHWSLVYRNIDAAGNEDAYTVSIDEAKKRLRAVADINLTDDQNETLKEISGIRNKIQHFQIDASAEQAVVTVNLVSNFLIGFLHTHLGIDIQQHISEETYRKMLEVSELEEGLLNVADGRIKRIKKEHLPTHMSDIAAFDFQVLMCPMCYTEKYVFIPGAFSECQLCNYKGEQVECARCGIALPKGHDDLRFSGPDYALCENCWNWQEEQ